MCTDNMKQMVAFYRDMFQFPSNGKAHVHAPVWTRKLNRSFLFQFPSNGKAHVHQLTKLMGSLYPEEFQFPSNGKAHVHEDLCPSPKLISACFNSLQTGKHMCTASDPMVGERASRCFNSLQTGKHMCTKTLKKGLEAKEVSIPFKRESTCARNYKLHNAYGFKEVKFQFPSNGKAHVHTLRAYGVYRQVYCFNSLQTGKHMCTYPIFDPLHA